MIPPMAVRYRVHPDLAFRVIDGEAVVLQVKTTTYFSLNPSGTVLWGTLQEGATRDALVDRLLAAFDVDRPRAEADVDALLADLKAESLVVEEP